MSRRRIHRFDPLRTRPRTADEKRARIRCGQVLRILNPKIKIVKQKGR